MKVRLLLLILSATSVVWAQTAAVTENEVKTDKDDAQQQQEQRRVHVHVSKPAWVKEKYPDPQKSLSTCKSKSNRLCDPDGILIDMERDRLVKQIEQAEGISISCGTGGKEEFPVQIAMAFCNRMDLIPYGPYEDREQKAAEEFAIYLHNQWGVGVKAPCGGTGVFIFFSILDRAFYISRGAALNTVLTDKRIDRISESIKPLLRQGDYAKAMSKLLEEVDKYLEKGPPSKNELRQDFLENLIPISFFVAMLGVIAVKTRHEHRESRTYAAVESQLSLLDRNRAEALQGQYQCTSCPICLENFETVEGDERPTKGSDGQPLKLLRCGHVFDESCWSEWVSSGTGNVRRCPICQQDVGTNTTTTAAAVAPNDNNRALRQYNRERHFRLLRLGMRYPRYVRQDQIQRWSQSTYEGSLARDATFVRTNPRHYANNNNQRSGGGFRGGSSFGGGSSGGGRGGSW